MSENQAMSFRLRPETVKMLREIESKLGLTRTCAVELAIRRLFEAEFPGGLEASVTRKPKRKKDTP